MLIDSILQALTDTNIFTGKFVVRGKIRFKNRKKKGRGSSSSVSQGKKSSDAVFLAARPPGPQGQQATRRRGKKSDDNERNHHVNHQRLSDQELEEEILRDNSAFSSDLRPPQQQQPASASRRAPSIRDRTDTIVQIQAAGTKNKKSLPAEISALPAVTEVHRVQGERGYRIILQTSMQTYSIF